MSIAAGIKYKFRLKAPDGSVEEWESFNAMPDEGKTYCVGRIFSNGTALIPTFYVGLCRAYSGGFRDNLGLPDIVGVEVSEYTGLDRPVWTPALTTSATNAASPAEFEFSSDSTGIANVFLCSQQTRGNSSGVLFSIAPITPAAIAVSAGAVLQVTGAFELRNI